MICEMRHRRTSLWTQFAFNFFIRPESRSGYLRVYHSAKDSREIFVREEKYPLCVGGTVEQVKGRDEPCGYGNLAGASPAATKRTAEGDCATVDILAL